MAFAVDMEGTAWLPPWARRGRAAVSNEAGRYERERRVPADDGWGNWNAEGPSRATTVLADASRTIIAKNKSPDIGFDHSINPYRGCEHGCIYCYARPTHAWLGLSPGLDFESRLFAKYDAAALLRAALARARKPFGTIVLGANTDAYQPLERRLKITRSVLRVLSEHGQSVGIITKSHLVTRDLDLLAPMAERGLVKVFLSVTTLDPALARRMEPRASTPARRLEAMARLAEAGVPTGVMVAPVIPGLTDMELERILAAAARAGARQAGYILLRLPLEIAGLFRDWLEENAPGRAAHVLSLMRQMRAGRLYDGAFGRRMKGTGPLAELLEKRFDVACKRLGLATRLAGADGGIFPPPEGRASEEKAASPAPNDKERQLTLF